ncbi:MAG: hypothetical protein N4A44_00580 [Alphaproteobacteria bacterium]|jgi:hypothetical protein|nr:hypothetical protein [Alphaproteobacteria bacterium]
MRQSIKKAQLPNNFKIRFIISKTIFDELKSMPHKTKQNFELIETMAQSIINLLTNNSKEVIKTTCKTLYENIRYTQKYLMHHTEDDLKKFNYGLTKDVYDEAFRQYKENKFYKSYQRTVTKLLKGYHEHKTEDKYREKLFHYHKEQHFPDWAKEQSEILKLSGFIFYNQIRWSK